MADNPAAAHHNTKWSTEEIEAIVENVCELISTGHGLEQALRTQKSWPSSTTFYAWLDKYEAIAEKYTRARELQQDYEADNIIEIADTEEDPAKARNRIDARKWRASKLAPKKYGDKITNEHTGKNGGAIEHTVSARDFIASSISGIASRAGTPDDNQPADGETS